MSGIMRIKKYLLIALSGIFFAACSGRDFAGTSEESEGVVAIKDKQIAGVTQKGPFLLGSSVTIQGLDGNTLVQTGKSFKALVKSNKGDFEIKDVSLSSQYALFEVNGYFRDEYTGNISDIKISLNAIADLKDRDRVNVNVVTHLVAGRMLFLVQKKGMSFKDAKKQAEMELFSSFGFVKGDESPEDMDIFVGESGAALLAISILLRSEDDRTADFMEWLSAMSYSFANSGVWEDDERTYIAERFMNAEMLQRSNKPLEYYDVDVKKIREYLETWDDSIPPFEKYTNRYWAHMIGLGLCAENNVYEIQRSGKSDDSESDGDEYVCNPDQHWSLMANRDVPGAFYVDTSGNRAYYDEVDSNYWFAENMKYGYQNCEKGSFARGCLLYSGWANDESCPSGFHLPSRDEFRHLIDAYGGSKNAAAALRSPKGFGATFFKYSNDDEEPLAKFCSSDREKKESGRTYYYYMRVDSKEAVIDSTTYDQCSIRCVKDR